VCTVTKDGLATSLARHRELAPPVPDVPRDFLARIDVATTPGKRRPHQVRVRFDDIRFILADAMSCAFSPRSRNPAHHPRPHRATVSLHAITTPEAQRSPAFALRFSFHAQRCAET